MTRFLLKTAPILLMMFTLTLLIARARPPSALSALLRPPDGCAAPCLLGAQPGAMPLRLTAAVLRVHPAVQTMKTVIPGVYTLTFDATHVGQTTAYMREREGLVRAIELFDWALTLGDVAAVFGPPERIIVNNTIDFNVVVVVFLYPQQGIQVYGVLVGCGVGQRALWNAPASIIITRESWESYLETAAGYYREPSEIDLHDWRSTVRARQFCPN